MNFHRDGRAGVTLLEILCVVAIAAMLMVTIFGTLSMTVSGIAQARETMRRARAASGLERILRRDLAGVYAATAPNLPCFGGRGEGVAADSPRFEFYTLSTLAPTERRSDAVIRRVEYALRASESRPGTLDLFRLERPWTPGKPLPDAQAERLASGITDWKAAFYDGGAWREQWRREQVPFAVRLEISFDEQVGGARRVEKLIFAPRITPGADATPSR